MKKLKFIFLTILSVYGQTDYAEEFQEIEKELRQGQIRGFVRDNVEEYRFPDIKENFQQEAEYLQYLGGVWSRGEEDCLGWFLIFMQSLALELKSLVDEKFRRKVFT